MIRTLKHEWMNPATLQPKLCVQYCETIIISPHNIGQQDYAIVHCSSNITVCFSMALVFQ